MVQQEAVEAAQAIHEPERHYPQHRLHESEHNVLKHDAKVLRIFVFSLSLTMQLMKNRFILLFFSVFFSFQVQAGNVGCGQQQLRGNQFHTH